MVRFNKIAAIGLVISLSSISHVFAFGLGEVTWKSTLNQPLNAEIALYDVKNITTRELIIKLASPEEFAKIGIERPHVLENLEFTPIIRNGKGIIKITSRNPIKEPYLDFLLSVSWASGEVLREYTLLIDPPAYEPAKAIVTQKVASTPSTSTVTQSKSVVTPTEPSTTKLPTQEKTSPKVTTTADGTVKVRKGSSLWAVADRMRGNASIHQAMLSIYEANPDAFINGKMGLLKEGVVLRIPTREQMRQNPRAEALAQVVANVNGTAPTKVRQINASKTTQVANLTKPVEDQLKLTGDSSDSSKAIDGTANKATANNLTTKVAQVEESLDATRRKNEELRSRMGDLEARLNDMKKLIALKDNQLAALQANIANQNTNDQPKSEEASDQPKAADQPTTNDVSN